MFRVVDAGTLRKLDLEGRDIASSLNYELHRAAAFSPIEPRLLMRGMYRYMADAPVRRVPHRAELPGLDEADSVALERAYLAAQKEPASRSCLARGPDRATAGDGGRRRELSLVRSASSASGPAKAAGRG